MAKTQFDQNVELGLMRIGVFALLFTPLGGGLIVAALFGGFIALMLSPLIVLVCCLKPALRALANIKVKNSASDPRLQTVSFPQRAFRKTNTADRPVSKQEYRPEDVTPYEFQEPVWCRKSAPEPPEPQPTSLAVIPLPEEPEEPVHIDARLTAFRNNPSAKWRRP